MSYADPQSITVGANTYSLPRISTGPGQRSSYEFHDATEKITLTASHLLGKRTRRVLRLDHLYFAQTDAYTDLTKDIGGSIYTVFDFPTSTGPYIASYVKELWDGFDAACNASSDALIVKLLNGES